MRTEFDDEPRSLPEQQNVILQSMMVESTPTPMQSNEVQAPDGGRQAWLQVAGSFMIFANIWGATFVFGVFQSYYELSYLSNSKPFDISWIGTIQSSLLVIVGVIAGPLFDLGASRIMMLSGAFLVVFGFMMLSLSTAYYQVFLSQGVCVGVGGGLLYVPCLALVGGSFTKKRSIAIGVMTCGIGIGGVIYIVAFEQLLPQLGFAWTVRTMGFIALGIFFLSIPTLSFNNTGTTRSRAARKLFDSAAIQDVVFLCFSAASFFIFLGYLVPYFYIPSFAQIVLGSSKAIAFYALAISSATSILGRLGSAIAAHYLGVMIPWIICGLISGCLCFWWITINTTAAFFTYCALYGFFSGALVALPPSIFPSICPDSRVLGTWMGMGWVCSGIAFLIGSPIAGALTKIGQTDDSSGLNFLALQVWSGLLLLIGTTNLLCLWWLLIKKKGTKILV